MKKIVLLLIASLVLVSCGRDNEPYGPDEDIIYPSGGNSSSTVTPTLTPKYAKIYYRNNSSINTYKIYLNGIGEVTLAPKSTSKAFQYYSGTSQIVAEQTTNIYNNSAAQFSGNFNFDAGTTETIDFPLLASLTIKSNSVDDYNVSINDGMWEYVILTGGSVTLNNLDCTTYKIKVTQRNGYFFYPTVETYYVKLAKTGTTFKFNP